MSNDNKKLSPFSPFNQETRIRASAHFAMKPVLDFIFCNVIAGTVAGIIAPGSTGKGFFSLGICFDLFTGQNKLGLGVKKLNEGEKIAFVTAEDHSDVIGVRLYDLMAAYGMSSDDAVKMDDVIHFISTTGRSTINLVDAKGQINFALADEIAQEYSGYRVIFIDTLARVHSANENDNTHMTLVVSAFEYIAKKTGAALVFLHHTNKSASLNEQGASAGAARGAAAITDNIRCQINLSKITSDEALKKEIPEDERNKYVWVHDSKVNYSETQPPRLLKRIEGGVLSGHFETARQTRPKEQKESQRDYTSEY